MCKAGGSFPEPEKGVTHLSSPLPIYLSDPFYSVKSSSPSLSVGSVVTLAWLEASIGSERTTLLEMVTQSGPSVSRQNDSLDLITIRCKNLTNQTKLCISICAHKIYIWIAFPSCLLLFCTRVLVVGIFINIQDHS